MSPEIEKLKEIIHKLIEKHDGDKIKLREKDKNATLTDVSLSDISGHSLLLKADKAKIQTFAKGYANKQCDYIIMSEYNKQKYAVFIELKSSVKDKSARQGAPAKIEDENEDYVTQLLSSSCLFDFFHSVLKNFCDIPALVDEYQRRYVVLHNKEIPEIAKSVPPTRPFLSDSPKRAYVKKIVNGQTISFQSLIRETCPCSTH